MRIKRGTTSHRRHKRLKKTVKGFIRSRRASVRHAKEAQIKKYARQYVGRRKRKRDLRSLWIIRINAAARQNNISYSQLMSGLKSKKIEIDRKILAEIAVNHPETFKKIVAQVK